MDSPYSSQVTQRTMSRRWVTCADASFLNRDSCFSHPEVVATELVPMLYVPRGQSDGQAMFDSTQDKVRERKLPAASTIVIFRQDSQAEGEYLDT
jgi:hypothetical protein